MLGIDDRRRLPVRQRCRIASSDSGRCPGHGPAAQIFAGEKDPAVHRQEDGRRLRFGEQRAERVFERQPDNARRDRGDDDEPCHPLVDGFQPAVADRADESADDPHPVAPEKQQQGERGRDVQPDDEREIRRLRLILLGDQRLPRPTDQRGNQHRMTEARHREQLRHSLHDADRDGLEKVQMRIVGGDWHAGPSSGRRVIESASHDTGQT